MSDLMMIQKVQSSSTVQLLCVPDSTVMVLDLSLLEPDN